MGNVCHKHIMPLQNVEKRRITYKKGKKKNIYTNFIDCHTTIQIENTNLFKKIQCKDCISNK